MAVDFSRFTLGLECGSTRIKAVLLDDTYTVRAQGSFSWENRLENGVWTYDLADAVGGVQTCFADLQKNVKDIFGAPLDTVGCIGISGMMHGFLAFDRNGKLLTPFRTWRNTMTKQASDFLSERFDFTIPERWSIAHLGQVIFDGAPYAREIARLTTLSGYIHGLLTGENVLGCNEASGMFPVDTETLDFRADMMEAFDDFAREHGMPWKTRTLFPRVLPAGQCAGRLTEDGARLLDPSGCLKAGIPFCPPEGDGGTGMICTGCVSAGSASVSVGTSVFGLFVLEKALTHRDPSVEQELTPSGVAAVQIHGNNGTSELDAWLSLFAEVLRLAGSDKTVSALYAPLLETAKDADDACGGVLLYNYMSGEHLFGLHAGKPLLLRNPDSTLSLANVMRSQLYAIFAPLADGWRRLRAEGVQTERLLGHGGLFKTEGMPAATLAAALGIPVTVQKEAGEGGPFGTALLAAYAKRKQTEGYTEPLEDFLSDRVFAGRETTLVCPDASLAADFERYLAAYRRALPVMETALGL